jgi:ribosomal protein S18 acetylase RimI-like enzyme
MPFAPVAAVARISSFQRWDKEPTSMGPPAVLPQNAELPSAGRASVCYFKRYKMEVDLTALPAVALPEGFRALSWEPALLDMHAEVLFDAFRQEIDATVFPSLGNRDGCAMLMTEIARRRGFVANATWLLIGPGGPCGSVQGLREHHHVGAIQNLGVVAGWRGRGLGEALLLLALRGFSQAGLTRGQLEVTASNDSAVRLYRRLGFRRTKTLYKAVPTACPILGPFD